MILTGGQHRDLVHQKAWERWEPKVLSSEYLRFLGRNDLSRSRTDHSGCTGDSQKIQNFHRDCGCESVDTERN